MTEPGLDLATLRAFQRPAHDSTQLVDRIAEHLDLHDGYLAFSGGKDSLVCLHLALQAEPNLPVVFFDSGLEYPETLDYLDQIAELLKIPDGIQRYRADPPLLDLLAQTGAWDHRALATGRRQSLREVLINRPARSAHAEHGAGEILGLRSAESAARRHHFNRVLTQANASCRGCCLGPNQAMRRHGGAFTRADGTTSYSPIWNWSTGEVWSYLARHQIPENPVYAKLRSLGAPADALRITTLLDGDHLRHGRVVWLCRGWPDLYEELRIHLPRLAEFT